MDLSGGASPAGFRSPPSHALARLYPQFDVGDDPRWEKVVERSKKGDANALDALGFKGDPDKHPVCAAILASVNAGKKGSDVRRQFASGQYGWPQDAIDGALILLSVTGHLRVTQNGLVAVPGIIVGTEAEVIASLEAISLEMWQAQCDALPQRFQKAQREAATLIEPKVVYMSLPSATIRTDAELEAWLGKVKQEIQQRLKDGPVGIG